MAAGLGFKDFVTGEVLTAADVDGYLMQGIWVFASAAARDAAVTSPQEGNFAFLKDTNTTTYYTGSAWTNLDTTGMVNPMTTTGDTIYSSSGSTPARLGIGTAGQLLRVNSGATAPEWATIGTSALTLLSATTFSASSAHSVNDVFSSTYDNYLIQIATTAMSQNLYCAMRLRVSGSDNSNNEYGWSLMENGSGSSAVGGNYSNGLISSWYLLNGDGANHVNGYIEMILRSPNLTQRTGYNARIAANSGTGSYQNHAGGMMSVNTSYTGFTLITTAGNMTGNVKVYGYVNS